MTDVACNVSRVKYSLGLGAAVPQDRAGRLVAPQVHTRAASGILHRWAGFPDLLPSQYLAVKA